MCSGEYENVNRNSPGSPLHAANLLKLNSLVDILSIFNVRRDRLDEQSRDCTRSLCCCPVISHSFELNPIPASPPTWGVVLCSVFERRNREAAFSINIRFSPCRAGLSRLSLPCRDFPARWMRCSCGGGGRMKT